MKRIPETALIRPMNTIASAYLNILRRNTMREIRRQVDQSFSLKLRVSLVTLTSNIYDDL